MTLGLRERTHPKRKTAGSDSFFRPTVSKSSTALLLWLTTQRFEFVSNGENEPPQLRS
jgi:hypothetical protein